MYFIQSTSKHIDLWFGYYYQNYAVQSIHDENLDFKFLRDPMCMIICQPGV